MWVFLVALLALPDAVGARLAPRVKTNLIGQRLDAGRQTALVSHNATTKARLCAAGVPTNFESSGCFKMRKVYQQVDQPAHQMTSPDKCFAFCSNKWVSGQSFFGLSEGNKCWCAKAFDGDSVVQKSCTKKCLGGTTELCGGIDSTEVFTVFDCSNTTTEEVEADAAARRQKEIDSYRVLKHQSCGKADDNVLAIDGEDATVGEVDECKVKCFNGSGSMQCHGFTFKASTSTCTFHYDVLGGKVTEDAGLDCYFKAIR